MKLFKLSSCLIVLFAAGIVFLAGTGSALAWETYSTDGSTGNCADCHGEDGKGDDDSPALAGLEEAYHIEQLQAFKSGERVDEDEMMPMYAEDLSEQDMADLAAYYATLPAE